MSQKQKKPSKPWNEQTTGEKIGTVIQITLGLAFIVACCIGGIAGVRSFAQDTQTQNAQDTATAAAQATTQAVLALTPSPTPTFVHHITDIVTHYKNEYGLEGVITGAACDSTGVCHVDVTEREQLSTKYARIAIQSDTYTILEALYNTANSGLNPSQITVRTFGSCVDKYGNTSTCQWAVAMLTKQTEKLFNWKNLDYEQAWADYDQTEYLTSDLNG